MKSDRRKMLERGMKLESSTRALFVMRGLQEKSEAIRLIGAWEKSEAIRLIGAWRKNEALT